MTKEQRLIFDLVVKHSGYSEIELNSDKREKHLVRAKHLLMYLYRECLGTPLVVIGGLVRSGKVNTHHATVINACKATKTRLLSGETSVCKLHSLVMGELRAHDFQTMNVLPRLMIRYPRGFPIHDVINTINKHYNHLTYELV